MDKKATIVSGTTLPDMAAANTVASSGGMPFCRIFDAAPHPVTVHEGPNHIHVYCNRAYDSVFGRCDVIGKPLAATKSPLGTPKAADQFDKVFRTGRSVIISETETRIGGDGGETRAAWFRQTLQPWVDTNGSVAGVICTAEEVTADIELREVEHANKKRLEFALDAGQAFGAFVWDVQSDVVHVDGPVAPIFGTDPVETARGLPADAFFSKMHCDDRERVAAAAERAVQTGAEFEEEYRVTSLGGELKWVLGRGRCLHDEAGRPTQFPGVLVDITRRKQMEEELARSSTIRRLSLESGGMGVWQLDLTSETASIDETLKRLLGIDEERSSFSFAELGECILPEDEASFADARRRAQSDGVCRAEFRILRPDGEVRWLRMRGDVHKDDDGTPVHAIGLTYDITDQKRSDDALRESEARFRSAFENAAVGIAYGAVDGRYLMVNDQLCRFLGYAREELLEMSFQEVTHPDHLASDRQSMQGLIDGEIDSCNVDKRYIRKDGSSVWAQVSIGCVRQVGGNLDYFVIFVKDISEQKAAEEALRESEQRLSHERAFLDTVIEIAPVGISIARDPQSEPPILNREARRMMNVGEFKGDLNRYAKLNAVDASGLPYEEDDYPTVRALKYGEECHGRELTYKVGGERRRWIVNSRPLHGDDGRIVAAVTAFLDVEEQRRLEEYRKLLIDELNHRVKNTLAVVQGLAQQTFKDDALSGKARAAFEGRLQALAATHELLTQENWEKTTLATVVEELLRSCDAEDVRTSMGGPPVLLTPKQAMTITMALHELCTNAVKYGALSNDSGRIDISWETTGNKGSRLYLVWRESGGPPVSKPKSRSFGSRMIEQALAAELEGQVTLNFQPDGLVCTIDAPIPVEVKGQA